VCDVTTPDSIVVGTHQWTRLERVRSLVAFTLGVGALVASNLLHERWLTFVGVTLIAAFVYLASTSGRVVHVGRERLETTSPFGVRSIKATDVVEVTAADDPYGSVFVVVRPAQGRPLTFPMRIVEEHPTGVVALHQFIDTAVSSGRLDPSKVSLKDELAAY
jgi:hypothetical protein